jgi:uncharacterized membrane protein YfcA
MAFTSVVGIATNVLLAHFLPQSYAVVPAVFHNWLAAAPVVALGAPFGAWVVSQLPRTPTLLIVSTLCVVQFVWTIVKEQVYGWELALAVGGVLAMNIVFELLFRNGERIRRRT